MGVERCFSLSELSDLLCGSRSECENIMSINRVLGQCFVVEGRALLVRVCLFSCLGLPEAIVINI